MNKSQLQLSKVLHQQFLYFLKLVFVMFDSIFICVLVLLICYYSIQYIMTHNILAPYYVRNSKQLYKLEEHQLLRKKNTNNKIKKAS